MQAYHTITGSMTVESESGEAYDKLAGQRQRINTRGSRPRKRRGSLEISVEARLVRAAMSEKMTVRQIAAELQLQPAVVQSNLKRLGLDKLVADKNRNETRRAHGPRHDRRTVVH